MFRNCDIAGCEIQTGDMGTPPNRASLSRAVSHFENLDWLLAIETLHKTLARMPLLQLIFPFPSAFPASNYSHSFLSPERGVGYCLK